MGGEVGSEGGDSTIAYFTIHKRERTHDVEAKACLHLAHNNNIMIDGYTLYG